MVSPPNDNARFPGANWKPVLPDERARHAAANRALLERLGRSKIFRDYQEAFRGATGMPLTVTLPETWGLPLQGDTQENPFCRAIGTGKACAACLEMQSRLAQNNPTEPVTLRCFAGLCDTAVPIRLGERLVGFLRTGQVFTAPPTEEDFARTSRALFRWGGQIDVKSLHDAYFASKILTAEQYEAIVRLLRVFAEHLSLVSNEVLVREEHAANPLMQRAKVFIAENQGDKLSLARVARAVNTSTFYFCKMFKQATGLTFTEYLARIRTEKAKALLLHPHARISEVAFEVGFQSLSQFNRIFRRVVGLSPTAYRHRLVASARR